MVLAFPTTKFAKTLRDHTLDNNLDNPEPSRRDAANFEKDYSFGKRIRATVLPDDKDLTAEVEGAIGAQLDIVGARFGFATLPASRKRQRRRSSRRARIQAAFFVGKPMTRNWKRNCIKRDGDHR
jgi:hypothetical protein